jgi:predicted dehydrogenase
MRNIKNITIHKIIDHDITRALNAAKMYTGAVALSGDPELFYDDPTTDIVVVTSCTNLHAEHLIKALKNGKAIYLQKAFPLTQDMQKRLGTYLTANTDARLCFGYHRTAAPFIQKIKRVTTHRKSPIMLNYRLNLSALEDQDTIDLRPRHGNIIDKASHIFDLFYYLIEAEPLAVSVEVIRPTQENIYVTDNFVAQISFSDGSVCVLQCTSLGHKDLGIEHMELHFDGKTIVMDDFVRLNGFGLPQSFDEVVRIPDKGREAYIRRFFNDVTLQERSLLFDAQKFNVVSGLTMHVDQLVCQGGGEIKNNTI